MERFEVFALIETELQYQVDRWRAACAKEGIPYKPDEVKTTEQWLSFIEGYYNDLVYECSHVAGGGDARNVMRKLAALCVKCMWHNGIVGRDGTYYENADKKMAFAAIEQERRYQDDMWPEAREESAYSVEGFQLIFGRYLRQAVDAWVDNAGDERALDVVRKLAAIAVRCMEINGADPREPYFEG